MFLLQIKTLRFRLRQYEVEDGLQDLQALSQQEQEEICESQSKTKCEFNNGGQGQEALVGLQRYIL
jgi:hypothetical protein